MNIIEFSMGRHPAVWLIDDEIFCEAHKDKSSRSSALIAFGFAAYKDGASGVGGPFAIHHQKKGDEKADGQSYSNLL
jgi:hypothetical protein